MAMDFGRITVDDDLVLYLFGTPGQKRFDFMWEILSEGMLGFIVMVDSTRPETFREAKGILQTFRAYAPTPYVVAANKQDMEDAWTVEDLRIALKLDTGGQDAAVRRQRPRVGQESPARAAVQHPRGDGEEVGRAAAGALRSSMHAMPNQDDLLPAQQDRAHPAALPRGSHRP